METNINRPSSRTAEREMAARVPSRSWIARWRMSDLDSRCEKCERDIKQLQIELNALRSETIEVVGGVLARVDEILAKIDTCNRQMFDKLQAQTEAGW